MEENVVSINKNKGAPMIKMSYKTLNSASFNESMAFLGQQKDFANFQAAYNVAKLMRKVQEELKIARELYTKKTSALLVKDEKGEYVLAKTQNGHTPFEIIEGKTEEFGKLVEDFLATEIEMEGRYLQIHEMGQVKLTPQQMLNLEPIFDPSTFATAPSPSAPQTV